MPAEVPSELAANLAYYASPAAVDAFSFYDLLKEEEYLFPKYFTRGDSVLDLACGLGRTTLRLHEMGMRVRGVDRSEVFIETAKKRFPHLDLRVGSFDLVDEPDASFDNIVIALNSIDYAFPEKQRIAVLHQCVRVLKPGGILIISSHNLKSLHWFSPYYGRNLRWKFRNCLRAFKTRCYIEECSHYGFYATPDYVVPQSEDAGLSLLEIYTSFSRIGSKRIDRYLAPYLHYVFTKPLP